MFLIFVSDKTKEIMTAILTNNFTNESLTVMDVKDYGQIYDDAKGICQNMGWDYEMFHKDVTIKYEK